MTTAVLFLLALQQETKWKEDVSRRLTVACGVVDLRTSVQGRGWTAVPRPRQLRGVRCEWVHILEDAGTLAGPIVECALKDILADLQQTQHCISLVARVGVSLLFSP